MLKASILCDDNERKTSSLNAGCGIKEVDFSVFHECQKKKRCEFPTRIDCYTFMKPIQTGKGAREAGLGGGRFKDELPNCQHTFSLPWLKEQIPHGPPK